jgi:hypothetical protein
MSTVVDLYLTILCLAWIAFWQASSQRPMWFAWSYIFREQVRLEGELASKRFRKWNCCIRQGDNKPTHISMWRFLLCWVEPVVHSLDITDVKRPQSYLGCPSQWNWREQWQLRFNAIIHHILCTRMLWPCTSQSAAHWWHRSVFYEAIHWQQFQGNYDRKSMGVTFLIS